MPVLPRSFVFIRESRNGGPEKDSFVTLHPRFPDAAADGRPEVLPLALRRELRPARKLLERAGLRCSLPRLKVLDVLCSGGFYSVSALHQRLLDEAAPISPNCVRQTLRRLHASGVLRRDAQRRYGLETELLA
ncbi:hypothetical protein SAMN05216577_10624 [Pseudomonas citronellolis]|uniref:Fe2+ zn2+ uptake regulation protein n=1 Tax=Pseudomonas citronellolis TaxID=53408 RepID=A0AAQ1HS82_9PSED|nr:hypothetical protein PcP3B5_48830 [Pseudomonas citronellolis]SFC46602.1 hypothetical protein SAMN05216577_10624 [Pseudomonas citronellolis]